MNTEEPNEESRLTWDSNDEAVDGDGNLWQLVFHGNGWAVYQRNMVSVERWRVRDSGLPTKADAMKRADALDRERQQADRLL